MTKKKTSWNDFNLCDGCEHHYIVHRCSSEAGDRVLYQPKTRRCKYRKPHDLEDEVEIQTKLPFKEIAEGVSK